MLVDQCIFCSVNIPWPWLSWTDGVRDPEISKTSIKSWSWHLLFSLEWSLSRHPLNESHSWHLSIFLVSMSLGLNIHQNFQSQWVSVLTTAKIISLDKSRSPHQPSSSLDKSWKIKYIYIYIPLLILGLTHKKATDTKRDTNQALNY